MNDLVVRLGRALGERYRIERELGQGGMATVYLAHDLRHERKVALKVLRPELAATMGPERFHREIQIAAQLQHPNILPLLDSGEASGFLYYVMPFIEGPSLRQRLVKEGELPVPEAARILRDVADALSAAHEKHIVHRDIKPENVLLSGRHALVADFGVAKAVSEAAGHQTLTTAGVALGTPTYMAPEQAAASPRIDHRADLYALGVMAYEMLTGRPPFTALTPQALLSAHVTEPPMEVTQRRATIPAPMAQLIMRCLAKKPADRPQTADELLAVLESCATPSRGITPTHTQPVATYLAPRRVVAAGALLAVVAMLVIGFVVGRLSHRRVPSITVSDLAQVTSEPGVEFQPAISPDGREVAFVAGPIRAPRLTIRPTSPAGGGGERQLADSSLRSEHFPWWSPDGDLLRFSGCSRVGACEDFEIGRMGGAVRPFFVPPATRGYWFAYSPDGSKVAYAPRDTLFVASLGDSTGRRIAVHTDHYAQLHSFAWSPEGSLIAYVNGNPAWTFSGNVAGCSIWIVSALGGQPRRVTTDEFMNTSPAWLDSRHLLFVSNRDGARGAYVVAVAEGGARGEPRIVPGIADPHSISYSAATRTIAFAKFSLRQNILAYPLHPTTPVSIADGVRITSGNQVIESIDVSPDGAWLAFDNNRRGNMDLYKMPSAGGEIVPLAELPGDDFGPRWSPDGTEVAYYHVDRSGVGSSAVMLVSARGGVPVALTGNAPGSNGSPRWSPDGLHIAFESSRTGRDEIWLLSRDSVGGRWHPEVQLTDFGCGALWGGWAPDGTGVVCRSSWTSFVLVSAAGRVIWRRDLAATAGFTTHRGWRTAGDGRTIFWFADHRDGRTGIWALPWSGGEARLVVADDDPAMDLWGPIAVGLAVGPDRLYVVVSEYESDIWVAKLNY